MKEELFNQLKVSKKAKKEREKRRKRLSLIFRVVVFRKKSIASALLMNTVTMKVNIKQIFNLNK
jgi:hypothetical protein